MVIPPAVILGTVPIPDSTARDLFWTAELFASMVGSVSISSAGVPSARVGLTDDGALVMPGVLAVGPVGTGEPLPGALEVGGATTAGLYPNNGNEPSGMGPAFDPLRVLDANGVIPISDTKGILLVAAYYDESNFYPDTSDRYAIMHYFVLAYRVTSGVVSNTEPTVICHYALGYSDSGISELVSGGAISDIALPTSVGGLRFYGPGSNDDDIFDSGLSRLNVARNPSTQGDAVLVSLPAIMRSDHAWIYDSGELVLWDNLGNRSTPLDISGAPATYDNGCEIDANHVLFLCKDETYWYLCDATTTALTTTTLDTTEFPVSDTLQISDFRFAEYNDFLGFVRQTNGTLIFETGVNPMDDTDYETDCLVSGWSYDPTQPNALTKVNDWTKVKSSTGHEGT